MAKDYQLGRLEKVDLREVWADEAGDFTPWLAGEENIALLSDAIDMDLEVEGIGKRGGSLTGGHRLQGVRGNEHRVLIKNQFG